MLNKQHSRCCPTPNAYISLTVHVQWCNMRFRSSPFSCPSEKLVCWRYSLCFLLAIWQHLYWKAQNCWARVYTVPPCSRAHFCTQLQFRWSNRPLFMCLLAEFVVWTWLWACTFPNVWSDIEHVVWPYRQSRRSAVWSGARLQPSRARTRTGRGGRGRADA